MALKDFASSNLGSSLIGGLGRAIDTVGGALGNPFPDWGISEGMESSGGFWPQVQATGTAQIPSPVVQPSQYTGPQADTARDTFVEAQQAGQVQGTQAPQPAQQTNTGGGFDMGLYPGWGETEARADFANTGGPQQNTGDAQAAAQAEIDAQNARMRGEIESGYGDYFANLTAMLNEDLPTQQQNLQGIAQSQQKQGESGYGFQREQGLGMLGDERGRVTEAQDKNLKNISENLRNAFRAGNIYLGTRGASDSSAAKQYSYALTKLGSQRRGEVMGQGAESMRQIATREGKLQDLYTQEINVLKENTNQKVMEIANWFSEAQGQIKTAIAEGKLNKGKDLAQISSQLLNSAQSELGMLQQEASNKRQGLDEWKMNQATMINQAKLAMGNVSDFQATMPQDIGLGVGTPQETETGFNTPVFGQGSTEEDKKLFG